MGFVKGFLATSLIALCANTATADDNNQVNIWNWSYNIGEHTVKDFEKDTGLKTTYVEYDSNELQEARLLAGNTGFDAAIVVSYYVPRMAKSGALQKIDHSKIPNWVKQNKARLEKLASLDPNNDYAYPYIEISIGIGYNKQKVEEIVEISDLTEMGKRAREYMLEHYDVKDSYKIIMNHFEKYESIG